LAGEPFLKVLARREGFKEKRPNVRWGPDHHKFVKRKAEGFKKPAYIASTVGSNVSGYWGVQRGGDHLKCSPSKVDAGGGGGGGGGAGGVCREMRAVNHLFLKTIVTVIHGELLKKCREVQWGVVRSAKFIPHTSLRLRTSLRLKSEKKGTQISTTSTN